MRKVAPLIILAMFLAGATLQATRMVWDVVAERMQLDYGEGIVLYQASQIFHLKQAFHPLQQYPHIVFHYPPVYLVTVKILTGLVGDPLLSGRIVSLAAALWLVGLFAWIVLKATHGYASARVRWFGAVFAGAWALQLPTMQWVPLARVDLLGLALQFTALSVIAVGPFRLRNQIGAFCLLLLGLYTKQSLLAIPAASILLIGLIRPVRAMWLASGLLATGIGVLLALAWATDGGVIRHWVLYNVNPFHVKDAIFGEHLIATDLAALIATGLAGFWLTLPGLGRISWLNWRQIASARFSGSPLRRTGAGFGLASVLGFAFSWGIGKEGSNINYGLDWQLALCPLTGVFLVLVARNWTRQDRGMPFLRPLLALLLGATAMQLGVGAVWDCNLAVGLIGNTRQKRAEQRREEADLVRFISRFPGPVVSENMMALLRAGKPIPFEPAIIKQTTATGIFDEDALVGKTSDRFFDAFILTVNDGNKRFSPRMLEAIHQNYQLYPFGGSTYIVYVRK